jgi:hypothetical protein
MEAMLSIQRGGTHPEQSALATCFVVNADDFIVPQCPICTALGAGRKRSGSFSLQTLRGLPPESFNALMLWRTSRSTSAKARRHPAVTTTMATGASWIGTRPSPHAPDVFAAHSLCLFEAHSSGQIDPACSDEIDAETQIHDNSARANDSGRFISRSFVSGSYFVQMRSTAAVPAKRRRRGSLSCFAGGGNRARGQQRSSHSRCAWLSRLCVNFGTNAILIDKRFSW